MVKVRVTPEVLQWAMLQSGVSVDDVALALGKGHDRVEGWLSGLDRPHTGDIGRLANLLGRPPELFFMSSPPDEDPILVHRRTPFAGNQAPESREELELVRYCDEIREFASWIASQSEERFDALPAPQENIDKWAEAFRKYLDWDLRRDQITLTSKSAVFKKLRSRVENRGFIVLVKKASSQSSRGFAIEDQNTPVIYINDYAGLASVRSYTLLHEMAHLMRGDEILHHGAESAVERICESFAASFLIPELDLREYIETYRKKSFFGPGDVNDVRLISKRYKASWHSVAIRLKNLNLADESLVQASMGGEADNGFAREPQTRPLKRKTEFGSTYPRLLISGVENKTLSELDARRYLRLKNGSELSALRHVVIEGMEA